MESNFSIAASTARIYSIIFYIKYFTYPTMTLTTDLQGLAKWAALFNGDGSLTEFSDQEIHLQLFADGDATWLMLSHYTSATTAIDYCFMASEEENLHHAREYIFEFLKTQNYSLPQLLEWLAIADFVDIGAVDEVKLGNLCITRHFAREVGTESDADCQSTFSAKDVIFEEDDDEKNPS